MKSNLVFALAQVVIVVFIVFAQWRVRVHHRRLVTFYHTYIAALKQERDQLQDRVRQLEGVEQ